MRNVLLTGIDFSDGALLALCEARRWAGRIDGDLVVVHVVEGYGRRWEPTPAQLAWLDEAGVALGELAVRYGVAWVELAREAEVRQAMMVIVGSHGQSGFQPIALGATAAKLALLLPDPVLVVPGRGTAARPVRPVATLGPDTR